MRYDNIVSGIFMERPNRFIALVRIGDAVVRCHVMNTGRCKELLISGAEVFLRRSANPKRSTEFDLVAVMKGDILVNIDSSAPNKAVLESLDLVIGSADKVRPEYKYKESRIDIYAESAGRKILIEVKGVTLEKNGVTLFPDAPTERGLRHIRELEVATEEGYECHIVFVIQMKGVRLFSPNYSMHREFGEELKKASESGVRVHAYECEVSPDSMKLSKPVEVSFSDYS